MLVASAKTAPRQCDTWNLDGTEYIGHESREIDVPEPVLGDAAWRRHLGGYLAAHNLRYHTMYQEWRPCL